MADRARHAFGAFENVDVALQKELIDAYDILFLKDANGKPYVGWIDKDGNKVIVEEEEKVITVEGASLPESGEEGKIYIFGEDGYFWNGEKFVNLCKPTDVSELVADLDEMKSEIETKANVDEVESLEKQIDTKVDAETVQTMIKEYSDSLIEVVEF